MEHIYDPRPPIPTNLQKNNNTINEKSATIYANSEALLRKNQ